MNHLSSHTSRSEALRALRGLKANLEADGRGYAREVGHKGARWVLRAAGNEVELIDLLGGGDRYWIDSSFNLNHNCS